MKIPYHIYDVFTDVRFGGNPLAVVLDGKGLSTEQMQKIANEFNLSETTFILPPENNQHDFNVRIFTPKVEVPTAGHPTIGTAYCLLNDLKYSPKKESELLLEEKVGLISVYYQRNGDRCENITMSQPLPEFYEPIKNISLLASLLSLSEADIRTDLPAQIVSCGNKFLYIPLKNMKAVEKAKLRADILEQHTESLCGAVYVFSTETVNENAASHGRMFAPFFGITEDSATGSASGPLGAYFVQHNLSDGKNMLLEQGYEMGRPSQIRVEVQHENKKFKKILVSGNSVLVAKGELFID